MTKQEFENKNILEVIEFLSSFDDCDIISMWNRYCSEGLATLYFNTESEVDTMLQCNDLLYHDLCSNSDYNPADKYVIINLYKDVLSFSDLDLYIQDLAESMMIDLGYFYRILKSNKLIK